jgi:hypothetical protein
MIAPTLEGRPPGRLVGIIGIIRWAYYNDVRRASSRFAGDRHSETDSLCLKK